MVGAEGWSARSLWRLGPTKRVSYSNRNAIIAGPGLRNVGSSRLSVRHWNLLSYARLQGGLGEDLPRPEHASRQANTLPIEALSSDRYASQGHAKAKRTYGLPAEDRAEYCSCPLTPSLAPYP